MRHGIPILSRSHSTQKWHRHRVGRAVARRWARLGILLDQNRIDGRDVGTGAIERRESGRNGGLVVWNWSANDLVAKVLEGGVL